MTLVADIMCVNGIQLFLSISWNLNFITTQHMRNSTDDTLYACTVAINNIYKQRGFILETIHFDREFLLLENRLGEKKTDHFKYNGRKQACGKRRVSYPEH